MTLYNIIKKVKVNNQRVSIAFNCFNIKIFHNMSVVKWSVKRACASVSSK